MKFCSFFLLFSSVFLVFNANAEDNVVPGLINGLTKPALDLINSLNSNLNVNKLPLPDDIGSVVTNNINNVQLPVKYPLPPIGTTACSTYPHADKGIEHFRTTCYTQLYLNPKPNYPFKCRKNKFTVGVPLLNVPFDIPTPLDFIPQAGYITSESVSKVDGSHFYYNSSFVEVQKAEPLYYVLNGVNLTVAMDSVITHYTDKGYVFFTCPLTDLDQPLCSSPQSVFLCTYAQFPNASDVSALVAPLNAYPFYVGKNLVPMDQTGC